MLYVVQPVRQFQERLASTTAPKGSHFWHLNAVFNITILYWQWSKLNASKTDWL